jgi:hypothetical protein
MLKQSVEVERPAKAAGRASRLISEGFGSGTDPAVVWKRRGPRRVLSGGVWDWTEQPYADRRLSPRACITRRQVSLRRDPQQTCSERQTILPVVLQDRTLLTSTPNGELSCTA